MSDQKLKIGIILGSTREGRLSPSVGNWVLEIANERKDAEYEIVDLRNYKLPFLGEAGNNKEIVKWNEKLAELDGFVFIVQEYNHSITAVLKNALDSAKEHWNNKAAGIVSYGSLGGARATEHLRAILSELQIAHVRTHPAFSLFHDFENMSVFKPQAVQKDTVNLMLDQLLAWAKALKPLRK
ncbi:MAG TPA: NAD(P)H-dependent oxidoreductase [Acholeplasmataceae bacterium]|jgi:NAD(P)H-dependent FMN reductase|nr:NAD(P)H-dependent oxidoreductase [Acholeplasmataceae bacterium]